MTHARHLLRRLAACLGGRSVPGIVALLAGASVTATGASAQEARDAALPLDPTRLLRFTTDEGTWISVDVSPDGETIVFDLLGDLYALPISGGTATRITSGMGFDGQPRYSPDGSRIVFVSDRDGSDNVWISDADGSSPRQVTDTEWVSYVSPEWTPDGEYVVVTKRPSPKVRDGRHDLFLYHVDGGTGVQMTGHEEPATPANAAPAPPRNFVGATFGSDPRFVWAAVANENGWGAWQIGLFDRETGATFTRTARQQSAMRPVVSPDGRWLVYVTREEANAGLRLRDLGTGEESWLVRDGQRDDQEGRWSRDLAPGSAFTPDSRALITSYGGKIMRVDVPSGDAEVVPFTAEVDQQMGPLALFPKEAAPPSVEARHVQWARPAPGGGRVTFSALARVYVQNLPDGDPRRLSSATAGTEHAPAWSPDGRFVAWVTWQDGSGGHVWRAPADGSGAPERLTRAAAYYDRLAWSPDGLRILAVRAPARERITFHDELNRGQIVSRDLVWIPASGGEATVITPLRASDRYVADYYGVPHFASDPDRVFIHEPAEGLVSVRWDGTGRRVHLKVQAWDWPAGADHGATEILASPDGRQALVLVNQNLWLLALPATAGDPTVVSFPASESAPVPVRRLSRFGADFPGWSPDGSRIHWTLGASLFEYDVDRATAAVRDSIRAAERGEEPPGPAYAPRRTDIRVSVAAAKPVGSVAFAGARIIPMTGDRVIENGTIVLDGDRITAVGPTAEVSTPAGARVIDASGMTIVPGWVDVHAHMWTPWGVQREQPWEYRVNLAYGVTTTRDPQTMTPDVFGYADRVAAGNVLGPRVFATGRGIHASEEIGSLDQARDVVRRYSEFWKSGTIKQYLVGDRKIRQWIVMAAQEQGVSPTTEGGSDFKMNLTLMLDGYAGLEHSLPIWPLYRDVQELIRQSGIVYTPTLIVSYGGPSMHDYFLQRERIEDNERLARFMPRAEVLQEGLRRPRWVREDQWGFPHVAAAAAEVVRTGGLVGMGSHGNMQGLGAQWEIWAFALGGMTPMEAMRVSTIHGARAIGMDQELGSLEPGKLADFQVLERNPLDDIRNTDSIRWLVIGGRVLDGRTLDDAGGPT